MMQVLHLDLAVAGSWSLHGHDSEIGADRDTVWAADEVDLTAG